MSAFNSPISANYQPAAASFHNTGGETIKLEEVDVENLDVPWWHAHQAVYEKYGRYKHIGPFTGDWDDCVVIAHDQVSGRGLVLGNEAPGVTKRTTAGVDGRAVAIGLTPASDEYPFRKWLARGESWESPWAFVAPFNSRDPMGPLNTTVPDFVRLHLGSRLAKIPTKPLFVYNTWFPFRKGINEELILNLADAAAACTATSSALVGR